MVPSILRSVPVHRAPQHPLRMMLATPYFTVEMVFLDFQSPLIFPPNVTMLMTVKVSKCSFIRPYDMSPKIKSLFLNIFATYILRVVHNEADYYGDIQFSPSYIG